MSKYINSNPDPIGNLGALSPSPSAFPGQKEILPPGARLTGSNASPGPLTIRGLNAGTSADGSGLPAPETPEYDSSAVTQWQGGPWPDGSRNVFGSNLAPGPRYTQGVGASPGPRPITGINANQIPASMGGNVALQVGNPNSMEQRISPNRGPIARIPVDMSGQFGQVSQNSGQTIQGNMPMGVPTFGNIGAISQQPRINFS